MRKRKLVPLLCGLLVLTACKGRPAEPSLSPKPSEGMVQPAATAVGSPCLEESAPPTESPVSTVVPSSGPTPAPAATREPLPAPWGDTPPETEGERRMAYFRAVMERFYGDGLFPDGTPGDFSDEPQSQNRFAVHDVDGDGREELIVSIITAPQPARTALVYDYTDKKGLVLELKATSQLSFYDGIIQAGWPVDLTSGAGVLWPYTLYAYDREEDIYAEAGSAQARTEALEGVKFPKEADADGDGVVYCLNMDYEHPVDGAAYAAWRDRLIQGYEMQISYFSWAEEQIQAMEDILTLEKAKDLIEKANAALAPILGEGAVPCEKEGWLLLEGYTSKEELLDGLKKVFGWQISERFYERCSDWLLKEEGQRVYICTNSRNLIGYFYDLQYDTVRFSEEFKYREGDYFSGPAIVANGAGNSAQVKWDIKFQIEDGEYRICYFACYGDYVQENYADADTYYEKNLSVILNGEPYHFGKCGGPIWLGEPYLVEEEENEYYNNRIEYYSGLTVFLMKYNEFEEFYRPIRFIVTESGMPTVHGVEVGDTMEKVLSVYPQFDMWGQTDGNKRFLVYPTREYTGRGDNILLYMDEDGVLERIEFDFDISN